MSVMDWNLLRTFIAVSEVGTLTGAAEVLKTTQPTVGRHIRELEALVGETLFDRLPAGMRATDKALDLLACVLPMRAGATAFALTLEGAQAAVSGSVRLTASSTIAMYVLPELVQQLLVQTPGLQIELVVGAAVENLQLRDADIAVRFFRPTQDLLITTSVGTTKMGLYAHERFIERHGWPASVEDLRGKLIGGDDLTRTFEVTQQAGLSLKRTDFCFRCDDELAQLAAVEQGTGAGALWPHVARRRPGLKRLFPEWSLYAADVWLCAHEDLRRSARMRHTFDFLAHALRAELAAEA